MHDADSMRHRHPPQRPALAGRRRKPTHLLLRHARKCLVLEPDHPPADVLVSGGADEGHHGAGARMTDRRLKALEVDGAIGDLEHDVSNHH